ncbi:hypothetical protein G7Y89_g6664 [Cudoniella acicularis]|uniref:SET domain-containing protein n=1 Tax=Cudoniella acicularis TaxID=354080 RepID=A0A8H4RKU6_9HELO|nr:hypothetical protein G7Y89_g6664 [Cudoniella acicularis]
MAQLKAIDFVTNLGDNFTDWLASMDTSWREKYQSKGQAKPSPACYSRVSVSAFDKLQLLTPEPSPPSSPHKSTTAIDHKIISPSTLKQSLPTPTPSPNTLFSPTLFPDSLLPQHLFTTEYFEVRKTKKKGMAAFATKDIVEGTVIIAEEPLFRCNFMGVFTEYEKLSIEQKKEYKKLCDWRGNEKEKILAIFSVNRFDTSDSKCGIFLKSSRFNHACHPYATCTYRWTPEKNQLITTALMPITKDTELTISYTSSPRTLMRNYGFWCECPGCPSPKDAAEEQRKIDDAFWT